MHETVIKAMESRLSEVTEAKFFAILIKFSHSFNNESVSKIADLIMSYMEKFTAQELVLVIIMFYIMKRDSY